ncbi:MAG: carbamoyl phosphate synthase small subunit [Oscillospiraceae bacterium]|jgi:carbamoyl-phosphate synthase small subunit|nr:carbamoyl phosphate synthase small subunit [Oscillospiraceae bacterium]
MGYDRRKDVSGKRYLILENGGVYEGVRIGAATEARGELVFTTGMVGYLETLTDPSYFGQIVVQTFPLIGNYGVITPDFESDSPRLSGYVVREACGCPSNFRSEGTLDAFLRESGVPGLAGVDVRALTRVLRTAGVMRAVISDSPSAEFPASPPIAGVMDVTCREISREAPPEPIGTAALIDYGAKGGIVRALTRRGLAVTIYPADTKASVIIESSPDGIMLSNGPGDPSVNTGIIGELRGLARSGIPMFGICLGHQLLALASGGVTEKLKFGHRGANQPALHIPTGRVYITSQNHGYAVGMSDLPPGVEATYVNANDGSCEGLRYADFPAFSVQFHPEACGGPLDTGFLFDEFLSLMGKLGASLDWRAAHGDYLGDRFLRNAGGVPQCR